MARRRRLLLLLLVSEARGSSSSVPEDSAFDETTRRCPCLAVTLLPVPFYLIATHFKDRYFSTVDSLLASRPVAPGSILGDPEKK